MDVGPDRAGFWARRQAQELAIHRWDAQTAAGEPRPIDRALAVDGIQEVFDILPERPGVAPIRRRGRDDPPALHRRRRRVARPPGRRRHRRDERAREGRRRGTGDGVRSDAARLGPHPARARRRVRRRRPARSLAGADAVLSQRVRRAATARPRCATRRSRARGALRAQRGESGSMSSRPVMSGASERYDRTAPYPVSRSWRAS